MNKVPLWIRFGLAVGFALAGWVAAPPALAQVAFTVNTASDDPDANLLDGVCQTSSGACSLRAAIQESNAQTGSDTINFSPALGVQVNLVLTVGGSGEDLSATGDLDVTSGGISIQPQPGQTVTIQAGNAADGVFDVRPGGALTLTNITVVGPALSVSPASPTIRVSGGTLQLNATTVRGSSEGWGVEQIAGTSVLNNVTITSNFLGGVSVAAGTATIANATIAQPSPGPTPAVIGVRQTGGSLTVRDSIVANHATDCVGVVTFEGTNIIETPGACALTNTLQVDPLLGALTDNGGPTQTMAPAPTSPAVNGDADACLATDQRGVSRPRGTNCDLGAYEYPVATIGTPAPLAVTDGQGTVPITATLASGVPFPVSIGYATANGTAVGGTDFVAVSNGVMTFAANTTTATAPITITRRTTYTGPLNFTVNYSTGAGGQVALMQPPTTLPVNITDADLPPTVGFDPIDISVTETIGTRAVTVTLSNASAFTTTVNYSTTAATAISGRDYTDTAGTLTFAPGVTQATFPVVIINGTRYYGPGRVFNLTLSSPSAPATLRIGASAATVSINEDDPPPNLTFSSNGFTVLEAAGTGVVTATLSTQADITITVTLATSDGTGPSAALAGRDYAALNTALTFAPGQTTRTTAVSLINNGQFTEARIFRVALSNPLPAAVTLGTPNNVQVTILDAQSEPTVGFDPISISVNEITPTLQVTVTLSNASAFTTTVNFNTPSGTALPGRDYTDTAGTLTFAPGVTQTTFPVVIINNTSYYGPGRVFTIRLNSPSGATFVPSTRTATVSINEDEPPPTLSFPNSGFTVPEAAGTGVVTATLSNQADITITVNLATSDGTGPSAALAGRDYAALNTALTFAPGQTTRTTAVSLINNGQFTEARIFRVALSTPLPAPVGLGTPNDALVTILDAQSPPEVHYVVPSFAVNRTSGSVGITVTLNLTPTLLTTVAYTMSDGTAIAGIDYVPTSGTLTFNPGQTSAVITTTILNSGFYVGDRQFSVGLSTPSNATLGDPVLASVTIRDDNSRRVYLPIMSRSYDRFRESEPNNGISSATGPVISGATFFGRYTGSAPLDNDYWSFTTSRAGLVTVTLTNMNPANQVMLMTAGGARLGFAGGDPYTISVNVSAAGTYYVRVVTTPGQTSDYRLQIVYP